MFAENFQCERHGEFVFEIRKVQRGDYLFRRKFKQQFPQRHAARFGPQIPARVRNGRERKLHDAFVRSEPAELLFVSQGVLQRAESWP